MLKSEETLQTVAQTLTFRHLTPDQWRMWRRLMRRQPQWFVLRHAGKRSDRWQAVAGPFCSPDDARAALSQLSGANAVSSRRAPERWQVASLTETMRVYRGNVPQLVEDLAAGEALALNGAEPQPEQVALAS